MTTHITILIDGPSGSGKTTLAQQLCQDTGFDLVHLDDFYPGWTGLKTASTMVAEQVLDINNPRYQRWDWQRNRPGEWVKLDPHRNRIIEGAGSITHASMSAASRLGTVITVRITADNGIRRTRALARDPDYEPWWNMWAAQEKSHFNGPGNVKVDLEFSF